MNIFTVFRKLKMQNKKPFPGFRVNVRTGVRANWLLKNLKHDQRALIIGTVSIARIHCRVRIITVELSSRGIGARKVVPITVVILYKADPGLSHQLQSSMPAVRSPLTLTEFSGPGLEDVAVINSHGNAGTHRDLSSFIKWVKS